MAAAIALRSDFTGPDPRRLARQTQDAKQTRRLLALATIYDGGSRSDAARIGDVGLQIIRDYWLSNRVFRSYENILDHCCDAWNRLTDQPWTIMSIGLR